MMKTFRNNFCSFYCDCKTSHLKKHKSNNHLLLQGNKKFISADLKSVCPSGYANISIFPSVNKKKNTLVMIEGVEG